MPDSDGFDRDALGDVDPEPLDPEEAERYAAGDGDLRADTPHSVEITTKQIQAVELRKAGYTFAEIADALGYEHKSSALRAVRSALNRWGIEAVDELRLLELSRLDTITKKLWPFIMGRRADDGSWARRPDLDAMRLYLQVSQRRSQLLGLDAPREVRLGLTADEDSEAEKRVADVDEYEELIEVIATEVSHQRPELESGEQDTPGGGGGPPSDDDPVLPSRSDEEAD